MKLDYHTIKRRTDRKKSHQLWKKMQLKKSRNFFGDEMIDLFQPQMRVFLKGGQAWKVL